MVASFNVGCFLRLITYVTLLIPDQRGVSSRGHRNSAKVNVLENSMVFAPAQKLSGLV